MRPREWLLVAIVYTAFAGAALARAHALHFDPGIALVTAAIAAVFTAASLYRRHDLLPAPMGFRLLVGIMLAVLCLLIGAAAQARWRLFALPQVVIPIAAAGSLLFPAVLLNTFTRSYRSTSTTLSPIGGPTFLFLSFFLCILAALCIFRPTTSARRTLTAHRAPGLSIPLPDWPIEKPSTDYDNGQLRMNDPTLAGRFISVRWASIAMSDDDVQKIWSDMGITANGRIKCKAAGHDAARFEIQTRDKRASGFLTMWQCPQDGRWLQITTFLNSPRDDLLELHERILGGVQCHTEGPRAPKRAALSYVPPPGYQRLHSENPNTYVGPNDELVEFDDGIPGRQDELLDPHLPDEVFAAVLKFTDRIEKLTTPPAHSVIHDPLGHERTLWSFTAQDKDNNPLCGDMMVWFCDVSRCTFIACYWTRGPHDPREANPALLPARCH